MNSRLSALFGAFLSDYYRNAINPIYSPERNKQEQMRERESVYRVLNIIEEDETV